MLNRILIARRMFCYYRTAGMPLIYSARRAWWISK